MASTIQPTTQLEVGTNSPEVPARPLLRRNGAGRAPARPAYEPLRPVRRGQRHIVRDFFAELARLEKQNGSREGIRLTADKPGDWPILVDTRSAPPKR